MATGLVLLTRELGLFLPCLESLGVDLVMRCMECLSPVFPRAILFMLSRNGMKLLFSKPWQLRLVVSGLMYVNCDCETYSLGQNFGGPIF